MATVTTERKTYTKPIASEIDALETINNLAVEVKRLTQQLGDLSAEHEQLGIFYGEMSANYKDTRDKANELEMLKERYFNKWADALERIEQLSEENEEARGIIRSLLEDKEYFESLDAKEAARDWLEQKARDWLEEAGR